MGEQRRLLDLDAQRPRLSRAAIAERVGRTRYSCEQRLCALGALQRPRTTRAVIAGMLAMVAIHRTHTAAADAMGVKRSAFSHRLTRARRLGWIT